MPKEPSGLYNHNVRQTLTRQLCLTTNPSGRSSYSYASSQVRLDPVARSKRLEDDAYLMDESYVMNANMDVDNNHVVHEDVPGRVLEVMPNVRVVTKLKAKRYDNSVSSS
jgi:hypothetical protein